MALTDTFDNPQSRVEAILQNAMGAEHEVVPQSRVEELLERLDGYLENIEGKITDQDEEIIAAVNAWLEDNFSGDYAVTDKTLIVSGMAADAKKTGDELSDVKSDINYLGKSVTFANATNNQTNRYEYPTNSGMKYRITNNGSATVIINAIDYSTSSYVASVGTISKGNTIYYEPSVPASGLSIYNNVANSSVVVTEVTDFVLDVEANMIRKTNLYITPEQYGAVGDGEADDTQAWIDAITIANAVAGTIVVEKGIYKITSDLPKLTAGVSIMGLMECSSSKQDFTIRDYRSSGNFLFEQADTSNANDVNGGVIANILIQYLGSTASTGCLYLKRRGWTGLVKNLYITGYNTAIRSEADDYLFENIAVINCGNYTGYAIRLAGNANYNHFRNLHIEQCYHNILLEGSCFANTFENMHIEMDVPTLTRMPDEQAPINLSSYGYQLPNTFINCFFTAIDREYYALKFEADKIPPFIKSKGSINAFFNNCAFYNGNISSALGSFNDKLYLAKGDYIFFNGCSIQGLDTTNISIDIPTFGKFTNNLVKLLTSETQIASFITMPNVKAQFGNIYVWSDNSKTYD